MLNAHVLMHRLTQVVMYRSRSRVYRCTELLHFHVSMHGSCVSMHTEHNLFCHLIKAACIDAQIHVLIHTVTKCILIVILRNFSMYIYMCGYATIEWDESQSKNTIISCNAMHNQFG